VLLFLFGLYYGWCRPQAPCCWPSPGLACTCLGGILFPVGIAVVLLKGPSLRPAPIAGALIVVVAMALFTDRCIPYLAGVIAPSYLVGTGRILLRSGAAVPIGSPSVHSQINRFACANTCALPEEPCPNH